MRTVSRAGLRKEPWIKHGKEVNTFPQSDALARDENSFCAKNVKKASRCHGALGRRFGRTRPLP